MYCLNVPEYKTIPESHHRLADCEEARGQLLRVFESEGQCIATFAWGGCSFPGELQGELQALVGQEVAILRLDGRYHIQSVNNEA